MPSGNSHEIEQLTQQFFNWIVFPLPESQDGLKKLSSFFWEWVIDLIGDFDSKIHSINLNVFCEEMTAIRLELFSLACDQKFGKETVDLSIEANTIAKIQHEGLYILKNKEPLNEETAIQLSILMKQSLEEKKRLDTWEVMGEYNFALGESRYLSDTGEQRQTKNIGTILIRNELLGRWEKSGIDIRCIARVANRIGVKTRQWNSVAIKRLAARLAQRLESGSHSDFPMVYSPETQIGLAAIIYGLYLGAKEFLKSYEIGAGMDKPQVIVGNQYSMIMKVWEEASHYVSNRQDEWLKSSAYRADGSGFGILFDYWQEH